MGCWDCFFRFTNKKYAQHGGSPIEGVKYQPIVLKETIMGDQDWNVLTNKVQGYTTSKVPFTVRLPQINTVYTCIVLIYSINSLVSFLIQCRNKCWTKRWTIYAICLQYSLPEWPHRSLRSFVISAPKVVRDFCSKIWRLKLKGGWITFPLSCLEIFSLVLANIGYMSKNHLHKLCACVCVSLRHVTPLSGHTLWTKKRTTGPIISFKTGSKFHPHLDFTEVISTPHPKSSETRHGFQISVGRLSRSL